MFRKKKIIKLLMRRCELLTTRAEAAEAEVDRIWELYKNERMWRKEAEREADILENELDDYHRSPL